MQFSGLLFTIPWFYIGLLLLIVVTKRLNLNAWFKTFVFQIKIAATFMVQIIYTYYYTNRSENDIFRFFDDGVILTEIFWDRPAAYFSILFGAYYEMEYRALYFDQMNSWIKPFESGFYNDNIFMIKMNSILNIVSLGFYEINALLFSTLALIGLFLICRALINDRKSQMIGLGIVSVFPSFALFMSGGLKETILIFGIGLVLNSWLNLTKNGAKSFKLGLLLGLGIVISSFIKPYFLVCLIPALIATYNTNWVKNLSSWLIWGIGGIIGLVIFHVVDVDLVEYVVRKQHDFINQSLVINPGSFRSMEKMDYSAISILQNLPSAIVNSTFTPFPWDIRNTGESLMFFENIIIAILLTWATLKVGIKGLVQNRAFQLVIMTAIPGMILIGLISPVLGATMRYRAPFLILIVFVLTSLIINQIKRVNEV